MAKGPFTGRSTYLAQLSTEFRGTSPLPLCPPLSRDYFITCPVIDMANRWARETRGSVFMYHAPESYGHSR